MTSLLHTELARQVLFLSPRVSASQGTLRNGLLPKCREGSGGLRMRSQIPSPARRLWTLHRTAACLLIPHSYQKASQTASEHLVPHSRCAYFSQNPHPHPGIQDSSICLDVPCRPPSILSAAGGSGLAATIPSQRGNPSGCRTVEVSLRQDLCSLLGKRTVTGEMESGIREKC